MKILIAISTYDRGIIEAKEHCLARLTPTKAPLFDIICNDAAEAAVEGFDNIFAGYGPHPAGTPVATGRVGDRLMSSPDEADPEIPNAIQPVKLQHNLSILWRIFQPHASAWVLV